VDHARRGDRQLRRLAVGDARLQVREGIPEDRLRDAEPAVDLHRRGRELDVALLVVELDLQVAGCLRHAVELVDEVHVPRRAAKLAVGGAAQPDVLLQLHDLPDRLVLDGAQVGVVALAGGEQLGWAQQAPDVIRAERGRVAESHQIG
jgi:hypothetical protein